MDRFVRGDGLWAIDEKYVAECARCGKEGLKRNMAAMYVKRDSYSRLKIMCHFCQNCLVSLADEMGVEVPNV